MVSLGVLLPSSSDYFIVSLVYSEKSDCSTNDFVAIHRLIELSSFILYDDIFSFTNFRACNELSSSEKTIKQVLNDKCLNYGEIEYKSFYRMLRKIAPALPCSTSVEGTFVYPRSLFYDLGSGCGRAVVAARLTQDFSKCIGIEILESLHQQSVLVQQRYNDKVSDKFPLKEIEFIQGSILDVNWSDGDVIFVNSTCFDSTLMEQISLLAERLRPGAFVVTLTKPLSSPCFEVLDRQKERMSWGPATMFIQRRLGYDNHPIDTIHLNIFPSDTLTQSDIHTIHMNQLKTLQAHWRQSREQKRKSSEVAKSSSYDEVPSWGT